MTNVHIHVSIKIILTLTLRVIGGSWFGVSKCTYIYVQYQSEVPPLIVRENPKIENDWPCAICFKWTVYLSVEAISLLFRAIYRLFKRCTYVFESFKFAFKHTVCINAYMREFAFTVWMGLCHNNVCSEHIIIDTILSQIRKRYQHNSLLFYFCTCLHCPHLRSWSNHDGITSNNDIRTGTNVAEKNQSWTEHGKGKEA